MEGAHHESQGLRERHIACDRGLSQLPQSDSTKQARSSQVSVERANRLRLEGPIIGRQGPSLFFLLGGARCSACLLCRRGFRLGFLLTIERPSGHVHHLGIERDAGLAGWRQAFFTPSAPAARQPQREENRRKAQTAEDTSRFIRKTPIDDVIIGVNLTLLQSVQLLDFEEISRVSRHPIRHELQARNRDQNLRLWKTGWRILVKVTSLRHPATSMDRQ